jgi:hypothetical protein
MSENFIMGIIVRFITNFVGVSRSDMGCYFSWLSKAFAMSVKTGGNLMGVSNEKY